MYELPSHDEMMKMHKDDPGALDKLLVEAVKHDCNGDKGKELKAAQAQFVIDGMKRKIKDPCMRCARLIDMMCENNAKLMEIIK